VSFSSVSEKLLQISKKDDNTWAESLTVLELSRDWLNTYLNTASVITDNVLISLGPRYLDHYDDVFQMSNPKITGYLCITLLKY